MIVQRLIIIFVPASLIQPAPIEDSPGPELEGYLVERCDISSLPFFIEKNIFIYLRILNLYFPHLFQLNLH